MLELVTLTSDALPDDTHVVSVRGREALSAPYRFEIGLQINDPDFDMDGAIRARATLSINSSAEAPPFAFHGIVIGIDLLHEWEGKTLYKAVLAPSLWNLGLTLHSRIFTEAHVVEIIEAVLQHSGLSGDDYELRLNGSYDPREHVCQYKESNLAFISRWMEREGLYYYFEQGEEREKLIITDHFGVHEKLRDDPIRFIPDSGEDAMALEAFDQFICRRSALPSSVTLKDYDYLNPTLDVQGTAQVDPQGVGEVRLYGKNFVTPGDGDRLAKIRAEEIKAKEKLFYGQGRVFGVRAGYQFDLDEHIRPAFNRTYLAVEVEHFVNQSASSTRVKRLLGLDREDDFGADEYGVAVTAIESDLQYRASERTPWPRIYGYEHAAVCGEADSQYAQLDDYGRYNVRVFFDESDLVDGSASTWIRMLQPHGGGNEGFHFPLRKTTEVLLFFLGGDPDRPVIAGTVPNAHTPSPVTSANHTLNVIQTGGLNRIEMRDDEGTQHLRLQSPPENTFIQIGRLNEQYNIHVETDGRAIWRCGGDWHRFIDGERIEKVVGDAVLMVEEGNHDINIKNGYRMDHVAGDVDEEYDGYYWRVVGDKDWLDVTGEKWDEIGGVVKEDYHDDHKLTVDGDQTIVVKGKLDQTVSEAATTTFEDNHDHTVQGNYTMKVPSGSWDVTCFAKSETITGDWSWDCLGSNVKLTVSATSETLIGIKNENLIGGKIESLVGTKIESMLALHMSTRAGAHLEMDGAVNLKETPCRLTTIGAKVESGATWISEKIFNIIL